MTTRPAEWPADAPIVKCPNGHLVTYWRQFVVGKPPRLAWFVRLSPRWVRDGDGWRKGKRSRRWRTVRMVAGRSRDELPDGYIRDDDGIHAVPPVSLMCHVAGCGVFRTPHTP